MIVSQDAPHEPFSQNSKPVSPGLVGRTIFLGLVSKGLEQILSGPNEDGREYRSMRIAHNAFHCIIRLTLSGPGRIVLCIYT